MEEDISALHIAVYSCYRVKSVHSIKGNVQIATDINFFKKTVNIYCIRHFVVSEYVMCVKVMECTAQYREMCYGISI